MSQTGAEYILGTDRIELERLRFQHETWSEQLEALLRRAGLRAGATVLDLGCGPGFTSCRLAQFVGPDGRVIACDESPGFIEALAREAVDAGLENVEGRLCRVEEVDLAAESLDAAYARWILSWLPDANEAMARVAAALRPGGIFMLQEYLDWGAMKLLPRNPVFDGAVAACMRSWHEGGGVIDISQQMPELARRAGLQLESIECVNRTGRPGSPVWRWIEEFFISYLPRLVERGAYSESELEAFVADLRVRSREEDCFLVAPVMADVVLRK